MNSSKHLLFGLLVLVLGLLAISTYQLLGKPTPEPVAQGPADSRESSANTDAVGAGVDTPLAAQEASDSHSATESTSDQPVVGVTAAGASDSGSSTEQRLYAAVSELESRLRGYIDDAVDRASEQSQAPSVDELGEQVAERVIASIKERQVDSAEVDRLNALAAGAPSAVIDAEQGPTKLQEVHFLHDSSELTPGAQRKAREAAEWFRTNNPSKIRVVGFSDTRGNAGYNLLLSTLR